MCQPQTPRRCPETGGSTVDRRVQGGGAPLRQAAAVPSQQGRCQAQCHSSGPGGTPCASQGVPHTSGPSRSPLPPRVRRKPISALAGGPGRRNARESLLPSGASRDGGHSWDGQATPPSFC
ncbi:hypothetical protein NDU88_005051 [Pleurodeles waltl]|uniref:Uncharacterized protein n=1 Tax=Pleurodeles waltl TaxID=8319 RepID=A0AAV7MA36_PLEWA|nr:hypothetical protein NDU88_005051 [Pleurodeles waltl]